MKTVFKRCNMTYQTDNTLISNREMLAHLAMVPLRAFGQFIVRVAEASVQGRALRELNAMSDAQLEARGLNRADAMAMFLTQRS